MHLLAVLKLLMLFLPIFGLLAVGMLVSLRSGVARLTTGDGVRQMLGNLTSTALVLGATMVALRVAQHLSGFRIWTDW